jgi:hypothetical protein
MTEPASLQNALVNIVSLMVNVRKEHYSIQKFLAYVLLSREQTLIGHPCQQWGIGEPSAMTLFL